MKLTARIKQKIWDKHVKGIYIYIGEDKELDIEIGKYIFWGINYKPSKDWLNEVVTQEELDEDYYKST